MAGKKSSEQSFTLYIVADRCIIVPYICERRLILFCSLLHTNLLRWKLKWAASARSGPRKPRSESELADSDVSPRSSVNEDTGSSNSTVASQDLGQVVDAASEINEVGNAFQHQPEIVDAIR